MVNFTPAPIEIDGWVFAPTKRRGQWAVSVDGNHFAFVSYAAVKRAVASLRGEID